MAETALISISDVRTYRQVDSKFDTTRFESFCMEIQRKNLRHLLGAELYKAFMADARTSGIYTDLLNGKDYNDLTYYGLKPALCYWWLALACREGDLFLSQIGAIQFQQPETQAPKEKERIATGYIETAQDYANDTIKFLTYSAADYPLWQGNAIQPNPTNFLSFKI